LLLAGALVALPACRKAGSDVLGTAPSANPTPILAALASGPGTEATIQGVLVEKCPVAGCWFVLHDATGTVRVDTKSAGFVVVDVPLNSRLVVAGRWIREGNETNLAASGVRY
jgi:uncharacterized protein YdeI (BOF family)